MRAVTVVPGQTGSARLDDIPTPPRPDGYVAVATISVGVCGTDREIVAGAYGAAPPGADRLVLGHEALGRVTASAEHPAVGQLVVPIVRHPDPVPCSACAAGEWDMCENGRYTEHGITGADGFARDSFSIEAQFVVPVPDALGHVGVLVEPASVVAKAWEQIERIGRRAHWNPHAVLVTGAGPVGLLAALFGRQRGLDVHVLDRVADGPKPSLVTDLGATYHTGPLSAVRPVPDIIVECTGVGSVVVEALAHTARNGIVCLAGLSTGARTVEFDPADLNRRLVLENDVVVGTVNANRRHYEAAVAALTAAPPDWLPRLITRRVPVEQWHDAFITRDDDVKVVVDFAPR